ncbi:MAG: SDR family oxidoreductase [Opitutaceae bacterium]|jgi:NAD(P)-dependent dehydrogenase (short-subunit alcohol dehydrogenase family)
MSLTIDLSGRRALVTGVTQGIGAGIARRLAEAGADVAGCGRSPADHPDARRFVADIEARGRRAFYLSADVSDAAEPARFVAAAAESLGGIDLLVSNAGRNVFKGAAACTEGDWSECMELDLASHWRLARAAKPHLDNSPAAVVVLIASNHAYSTLPGCFPYNVAKAGMLAIVQSLALEWGPKIRAAGIAPGFIDTPGNDTWFAGFPDPAAKRLAVEKAHPVGRIGTPEEVGALCAFLASDHARFISGTTLLMDGGHGAGMGW